MTAPKLPRLALIDASVFAGLSEASAVVCGPDGCYPGVDSAPETATPGEPPALPAESAAEPSPTES